MLNTAAHLMNRRSCSLLEGCQDLNVKIGNTLEPLRTGSGAWGGGGGCSNRSEKLVSLVHQNFEPHILINNGICSNRTAAEVVRLKRIRKSLDKSASVQNMRKLKAHFSKGIWSYCRRLALLRQRDVRNDFFWQSWIILWRSVNVCTGPEKKEHLQSRPKVLFSLV